MKAQGIKNQDWKTKDRGSSMHLGTGESSDALKEEALITPRERPKVISGQTIRVKTSCGYIYVTLNEDDEGKLFELFCKLGKTGGCGSAHMEALGIVISKALRSRVDPHSICRGIKGIRCPYPETVGDKPVLSCPDAIARVIEDYLTQGK